MITLLNVLSVTPGVSTHTLGTHVGIQSRACVKHEAFVCGGLIRVIIAPAQVCAGILARCCGTGGIKVDHITLTYSGLPTYKLAVNLTCSYVYKGVLLYRYGLKGRPVLLSNSQAGPNRNFSQPRAHLLVHLCTLVHSYCSLFLILNHNFAISLTTDTDRTSFCHNFSAGLHYVAKAISKKGVPGTTFSLCEVIHI